MTKQTKVSIFVSIEAWNNAINATLNEMKQPMNQAPAKQQELDTKLKSILKEALEGTQQALLTPNSGYKADPIGYINASTEWSSEKNIKQNKHCAKVNQFLQELIDEQNKESSKAEAPASVSSMAQAVIDSKDDEIKDITLESPEGNSKLVIDKTTGDTTVLEKQANGEFKKVSILRKFYNKACDFTLFLWNYLKQVWTGFTKFVKSFFKAPEDAEVILKEVQK